MQSEGEKPTDGKRQGWVLPLWVGLCFMAALPLGVIVGLWGVLPPWAFMWALAVAQFAGCKVLSLAGVRVGNGTGGGLMAYLFAWPGLDARRFLEGRDEEGVTGREWFWAFFKTGAGLLVLFGLARLVPGEMAYARGWVGMVGFVTALHFGVIHLSSCAFRARGISARRMMEAPGCSRSLGEFWGRRWNTAFRDLAHRFLFKPLTERLGVFWGLWAGFLFSGLVHDMVISVPAGGGYGWPTAYFLIQAAGVCVEKSKVGRKMGLGRGWRGWVFTFVVLVAPVGMLFHRPFVEGVFEPFMRQIGAL